MPRNNFRYGAICALVGCWIIATWIVGWERAMFITFFGWLVACVIDGAIIVIGLAREGSRHAADDDS